MTNIGLAFRPGIVIAGALRRGGILAFDVATYVAIGVTMYVARKPNWAVPDYWVYVVMSLAALAIYVSKSQAEKDRADKEAADVARQSAEKDSQSAAEVAFEMVKEYKGQIAGPMAYFACAIVDEKPIETVRMAILSHAVDVARKHLRMEASDRRLSATWAVARDDYTQWETVAYDRYHADRQPGTRRPIQPGAPGAPRAFLTGEHDFIADTRSAEMQPYFPADSPYRSILSVPARILNVQGMATRNIGGRRSAILGVLSLDCTDPGILRDELRFVVSDVAFLLAIVELIGGSHARA